jgi:hypothetical protein
MARKLRFLGPNARLYRNSGTYDSPVWNRISLRSQLALRLGTTETDVTAEDSEGEEETQVVLRARSLEFEQLVSDPPEEDEDYNVLDAAYESADPIEFAVASGDISVGTTRYRRLKCQITQFDEDLGVKDAMKVSVSAKKCPGEKPTTENAGEYT